MTDAEPVVIIICSGIIVILLIAGLLTMLPGFVCWAFGKKEAGDKLVKFGATCGTIVFSLGLVGAAWTKRSWNPLIVLVAVWVIVIIFTQIKKNKKTKDEQKQ